MNKKPFCIAPVINLFLRINTKNIGPCCAWDESDVNDGDTFEHWEEGSDPWKNKKLTQFRESMYTVTKYPTECIHCVKQEKAGIKTDRTAWDEVAKWYPGKELDNLNKLTKLDAPMTIHYHGGNMCNLKCIMCDASSSTEWQKEITDNKELHEYYSHEMDWSGLDIEIIKNLDTSKLRLVRLASGEPTLDPSTINFLKYLVEAGNANNIDLLVTTNATNFNKNWQELIKNFNEVNVQISCDGAHETYEYIRVPAKWNHIEKNIKKIFYSELIKNTNLITVIQPANLLSLKTWIPWFIWFHRTARCDLEVTIIDAPSHFLISVLPDDIKEDIAADMYKLSDEYKFDDYENETYTQPIISLLNNHTFDPTSFEQFKKVTNILDKLRGNSLEKLAPEYYKRMFKMG